ncbi:MAG: hypothetical protein M1821_009864 [Bathelium mastoideum]|nr:MAG: hypothetical protein M1821_009864 [Bathelium mastoideum]KAI9690378.1 MAG: hypothetical protein M1822_009340 [Bathelium mastoideum]
MNIKTSQTGAPKFGSFRPKTTGSALQAPQPDKPADHDTRRRHDLSKTETSRKCHYDDRKAHSQSHRWSEKDDTNSQVGDAPYQLDTINHARGEGSPLYVIDHKGDTQNAIYQKPDQYQVPHYRREVVIGMRRRTQFQQTSYRASEQEEFRTRTLENWDNPRKQGRLSTTATEPDSDGRIKYIRAVQENERVDETLDFIPISSKKRKLLHSNSGSGTHDALSLGQTSVANSMESWHDPNQSDLESTSDASDEESFKGLQAQDASPQAENARLSRLVKDEPNNISAWIDLINHQDQVIGMGREKHVTKASEKGALARVKIAIYEDALKHIGEDVSGREDLLQGLIEEGCQIWDSKTMKRKWKYVLDKNPRSLPLRLRYLDFTQSEPSTFRYDDCRIAMLDALKIFKSMENPDTKAQELGLSETQIYVYLRLTRLMHESGYQEHALALWQAAIEFYLFRPDIRKTSSADIMTEESLLQNFEDFWDEEVPRFGEPDAMGWCDFYKNGGKPPGPNTEVADFSTSTEERLQAFAEIEDLHMRIFRAPGRTIDEALSNDPYHVVLASDMVPVLSLLPASVNSQLLLDAFTCFCQMPPVSDLHRPTSRQRWWLDPFLRNDWLRNEFEPLSRTRPVNESDLESSLFFGQTTARTLFSHMVSLSQSSVPTEWMRHALKSLVDVVPQTGDLSEYRLAFEYEHDAMKAKRTAKNLLKKSPSNLRLWNAYALGEYRAGHIEAAEEAISAAIRMAETLPETLQGDSLILRQTWAWDALDRLNFELALTRAMFGKEKLNEGSLTTNNAADALGSVETQRSLEREQLESLSARRYERFAAATECLALVVYLPNLTLADALSVYQSTLDLVLSWRLTSSLAERIHQARAQLIAYHISGGQGSSYPSAHPSSSTSKFQRSWAFDTNKVRKTLRESLSQFPDNTVILDAHVLNEFRFPLIERDNALSNFSNFSPIKTSARAKPNVSSASANDPTVKATTSKLTEPGPVRYAFAAAILLRRLHFDLDQRSATIYKLRSVFQRATASPGAKYNAGLWKINLGFEINVSAVNGDRTSAKEIFFRGLRQIPWCKDFAIMGFTKLGTLSAEELKGVWEMMVERELRIYVDSKPVTE